MLRQSVKPVDPPRLSNVGSGKSLSVGVFSSSRHYKSDRKRLPQPHSQQQPQPSANTKKNPNKISPKMRYFALLCVPAVAFMATVMLQPAEAQVISALTAGSLVVAGLATLALAKEGIIASGISRGAAFEGSRWGKREAEHVVKVTSQNAAFGPFFEAIARADSADCGKLLVCQIMAKPEEKRTVDEKRVAALFEEDLEHIDASASYVNFQLAALVGTLKNPAYCSERYAKCPSSVRELQEVLHIYSGSSPQVDF